MSKNVLLILMSLCSFPCFATEGAPKTERRLQALGHEWISLAYRKIPPNSAVADGKILTINVAQSAGPLVAALPRPLKVKAIKLRGEIQGNKTLEATAFDEDSFLRVGLVIPGDQKLGRFQRLVAADWVLRLFELAPPGRGISRIEFLMLSNRPELVGKSRVHPASELIHEKVMGTVGPGKLDTTLNLPEAVEVAALWLSSDGDQTQSSFSVRLDELSLISEVP